MGNWNRWTKKEKDFVRAQAARMTDAEMAQILGRSTGSVQAFRGRNDIDKGAGLHYALWTESQDAVIRKHWPGSPKKVIKALLPGRTMQAISTRAKNLGVDRDPKFRRATQYTPQRVVKETDEGVVTICKGGGIDYCYLVRPGKQPVPYHRYRWARQRGPIPEGCCLVCRSEDTTNTDPSNWKLISVNDHLKKYSDPQAGARALDAYREKHGIPGKKLTDGWIAGVMAGGDQDLKAYIINERPDVIRAARANYKLKRSIDHASKKTK